MNVQKEESMEDYLGYQMIYQSNVSKGFFSFQNLILLLEQSPIKES